MIQQAIAHHRQGQLDAAERLYGQVLQVESDNFDALHLLGVLMHQRGRCEAALTLIGKALAVNARSADACANQARVLGALGRFDDALASYDRALALQPDFVEALYDRAKILHGLQHHEAALASYDAVLSLRPQEPEVLKNRGAVLHRLKREAEALESYARALALRPEDAALLNGQGNALADMQRFDEALASYERAVALRPDYLEAHFNRGNVLSAMGRHDAALMSYDRVLALRPNDTEALHNRGLVLQEKNNSGIVLPPLRRSSEPAAGYAGFYVNLDRSPGRQRQIEAELGRHGLQHLYRRFAAADGNVLGCSSERLTAGEIGCFTSHFLLLKQNADSGHHLHVIEDDVLLSPFTAPAIVSLMSSATLDRFDILFTEGYTMRRDYPRYKALYEQCLERDASHGVASVRPRVVSYVAGTTSYIVNRHSIAKIVDILARELEAGLADPLDLVIRKAASKGAIRIGCLFPFVTTLRLEGVDASTIAGRDHDPLTILAHHFGRQSFFVDCDHAALYALAAAALAPDASHRCGDAPLDADPHRRLLDRIAALPGPGAPFRQTSG